MSSSNVPPDSISVTVNRDIRNTKVGSGKIILKTQLQGMLLTAIEQMAYDRRIEMGDLIKEIVEQRLVKDGYLPEWWFQRKKGVN